MSTPAAAPRDPVAVPAAQVWVPATAIAAVLLTTFEALVLQQKKSFFTGGFLAGTHAASIWEAAAFALASVVIDATLLGAVGAIVLVLTGPLRLGRRARLFLTISGSMAPLLIWTFVNYSLLAYLGDAFDLGLMFDLVGRNPREILAVASSHLIGPVILLAGAGAAVGAATWLLNGRGGQLARWPVRVSRRFAAGALVLILPGMAAATAASAGSDLLEDGLRRKASGQFYTRITESITDFDRDGFGLSGRSGDPAPFDAAIYPHARDVPGNGVDEDAVGGDLPTAEPVYDELPRGAGPWRQRPNVVLFVLESFRADALGQFVNGKAVTPVLDALGEQGISSSHALSHNGYTIQSRFHLFTGSLAGLRAGSLIDDFNANGYQTAYFSAQDESFGGPKMGVGFDRAEVAYDARQDRDRRYSTFTTAGSLAVSHATLRERIDQFLRSRDTARPLFLYVNFHDTHYPYRHADITSLVSDRTLKPGAIVPGRKDELREMYLNTAANVDRALGATLEDVTRAVGVPPAVVVTGDHGESLFDEGFLGHGYALNDVQTRIPLVIRGLPVTIEEPFGQVDLRDAINRGLASDSPDLRPRLVANPGKTVFQYLGNIQRPRQIATTDSAGRLVFDFRNGQVVLPDGQRSSPEALTGPAAERFLRLVRSWERMMLAKSPRGASPDE